MRCLLALFVLVLLSSLLLCQCPLLKWASSLRLFLTIVNHDGSVIAAWPVTGDINGSLDCRLFQMVHMRRRWFLLALRRGRSTIRRRDGHCGVRDRIGDMAGMGGGVIGDVG